MLLRDLADPPRISAINLAEVLDVLVRHQGWPVADVEERISWLRLGGLTAVSVDEPIALAAGRLHARLYHREQRPLSMADCVALATALALSQRLATSDAALLVSALGEGCEVVALVDSQGRRPKIGDGTASRKRLLSPERR